MSAMTVHVVRNGHDAVAVTRDDEIGEIAFRRDPRETPEQERIRRAFCARVVREGRRDDDAGT